MAQILGTLLSGGLSSIFGQNQQQNTNGLTPEEMAMLQYSAQQEGQKLTSYYSDAGIPGSSGLAYDLGSIPFQTAAAAGGIEQGNTATTNANTANIGSQLGNLGTTLGNLNSLNTGATAAGPDASTFATAEGAGLSTDALAAGM
jgi:hypothetical protein